MALMARTPTAALPMIGTGRRFGWWGGSGSGDRDRTGMASLEDCARRVVRGPDLRRTGGTVHR
jgi:hypothetical protein